MIIVFEWCPILGLKWYEISEADTRLSKKRRTHGKQ
jgi:hypothetical protein|tara:strand:- start:245 stop:352 length:108 start_codon:yes stop_codon:yes gene_type:complete